MKLKQRVAFMLVILMMVGSGLYLARQRIQQNQKEANRVQGQDQESQQIQQAQQIQQTEAPTPTRSAPVAAIMPGTQTPKEKKQCHQVVFQSSTKRVHARELLNLPDGKINERSICVRVNGVPVKHQIRKAQAHEILIDGLPAQAQQVVVQYCDAQTLCPMPCQVKKDEFLSALSGGDENLEGDPLELAQGWEGSAGDAELDAEEKKFKAEVKDFRKEIGAARALSSEGQFVSRWRASEMNVWCENSLKAAR